MPEVRDNRGKLVRYSFEMGGQFDHLQWMGNEGTPSLHAMLDATIAAFGLYHNYPIGGGTVEHPACKYLWPEAGIGIIHQLGGWYRWVAMTDEAELWLMLNTPPEARPWFYWQHFAQQSGVAS